MASRITASLIALLAAGALAWVVLGSPSTETAVETPVSTQPESDAAPSAGSESSGGDSAGDDAADAEPSSNAGDSDSGEQAERAPEPTEEPVEVPENFGQRMDLVEIDGWLNTEATSIDDFNGQVLLVEMWTFGCHNCKARIPYNQGYYEEFAGENFEIIGVHAPEFSYEAEVPNIVEAAERLGVNWPIALDTEKKNFRAWQPGRTNFWPRTYVIDQNGDIRFDHIGEGKYDEVREVIRFLIENPPAPNPAT